MSPMVLAVFPLTGLALQSSERVNLYLRASKTSANPVEVLRQVFRLIDNFLDSGNFRPVGRFVEFLGHGVAFEAAEATALAPHEVLGFIRLAMIALVALLAVRLVGALQRSAAISDEGSLVAFYPLALGVVAVAGGVSSTMSAFPHVQIGSVALILGIALKTARDRDLSRRRVRWHEYLVMAAWGAVAAGFSDLAYAAPLVALGFVAARVLAGGFGVAEALASAATRRWLGLCAGFAAVFVPARAAIAQHCGGFACDVASDIGFPPGVGASAARFISGLPMSGWRHSAREAGLSGLELGFGDMRANLSMAVAVAAIVGLAAAFFARGRAAMLQPPGVQAVRPAEASGLGSSPPASDDAQAGMPGEPGRLAAVLAGLGIVIAAVSAVIAGSAERTQGLSLARALREGWRETLLTQIGWSLVIAGGLAALDIAARHRLARRAAQFIARRGLSLSDEHTRDAQLTVAVRAAAALVLAVGLMLTLRANWQFSQVERFDSASTVTSLIGASTVNLDDTDAGNEIRCSLIDSYTALASPTGSTSGENLQEKLDDLMAARHGVPQVFCDRARLAGADFVDFDFGTD